MSKYKLSGTLDITLDEAAALIADYFKAFPKIKGLLDYLGRFGVKNGWIMTLQPFVRKRWYAEWSEYAHRIDDYLSGDYVHTLGEIERASKNMPIQGSAADIAKLSLCLIRWYIQDNNLDDKVKIVAQVHDQNTTIVKEDFAEEWKLVLHQMMLDAALVVIPNGLLGADTTITDKWSK